MQEDISNAISEFNQYEDEIMSKLSKNTDILKITHFCLTVIEFSRQIIQLMQNMTELANEIALRRRIGRFQWFIQKIQHHRAHYSLSNITLFQINYAQSLSISCWKFFSRLQNFEVKFAFKTAITVTLMALPAFIEDFQDIYYAYRLNWAMTSALIVMTPSVGGTNLQGVWRLFGTWAGAGLAVFIWIVGHGNPFILAPSCFIIAVPAYALILKSDFKVLGRVI